MADKSNVEAQQKPPEQTNLNELPLAKRTLRNLPPVGPPPEAKEEASSSENAPALGR